MSRSLRTALTACVLAAASGCGAGGGAASIDGDSRCEELVPLTSDERSQTILRVSAEVGAAHAGNPLWLGQISTYCVQRPEATLREAFGRGDSSSQDDGSAAGGEEEVAPDAGAFAAERTYRWDTQGDSGGTATVELALGGIASASDGVPSEHASLTGVCDVDEQRDAFLPIRLTVRNTTSDFDLSPSTTLRLQNVESRFDATVRVDAANDYSDGTQCDALTDGSIDDGMGVGFDGLAPDEERTHDTLLVLHDYYTPAMPDGDDDALAEWFVTLLVQDDTSALQTQCYDAPADRYAFTGGFLRLGGVLSPGLSLADRPIERRPGADDDPPRCADGDPANRQAAATDDVPAQDAPCLELNTGAEVVTTKTRLGARRRTFDRAGSLAQVCWGFGAPEGVEFTPGMQCALIAAAATYGPLPARTTAKQACSATGVQQALESGDWAGEAASAACGVFADVFAGAVGIVAAGSTAATGPGAAAVGVGTYKAFSAGLTLACGGLFDGGAEAVGEKLEADHQRNVAADILEDGRCLRQTTLRGVIRWSAADCP